MKKIKTSLVGLLLSCMALAGCGETPASSVTPASDTPASSVTPASETPASSEAPASEEPAIPAEADFTAHFGVSFDKDVDLSVMDITITNAEGETIVTDGIVDENNDFTFHASTSSSYTLSLNNIPDGYTLVDTPTFMYYDEEQDVTLRYLAPDSTTYAKGDKMYDYTFTECTTKDVYWLSDTLKEKDLVAINFWYDGCTWCEQEFPYLEQVYEEYSSVAEVFALSFDANAHCKKYKASHSLTFPMGKDPDSFLQDAFSISGYPTTVYVTSGGKIRQIDEGATLTVEEWETNFSKYAKLPTD